MVSQTVLDAVASMRTATSKLSVVPSIKSKNPALGMLFCDVDAVRLTIVPDAIRSIRTVSTDVDEIESSQSNCLSMI